MEPRIKALETHVDYIRADLGTIKSDIRDLRTVHDRDFRISFGALIVVALGLAGLMAKGFKWI